MDEKMKIKQGKSGRHPELGIITQIEDEEGILLGGKYNKKKKFDDIIDRIL